MKTVVDNEQSIPANFGGDSGGNSSDIRSISSSTPLASPLLLGTISLEEYSKSVIPTQIKLIWICINALIWIPIQVV